jgi:hypothetical protein
MRRHALRGAGRCAALLLGAGLLTGCLRVDQTLTIKPDGSGTIELKYSVAERAVTQLKAMRKLQSQLARVAGKEDKDDEVTRYAYLFLMPREEALRRECERYADLGIEIEKLDVSTRGAWRNVNLKLVFKRIDALPKTPVFKYIGFSLVRNKYGQYVFHRVSEPDPAFNPPNLNDPAVLKSVSPILGGFRVSIRLNTPGRILKTNAPRRSSRACVWVYDFARDPMAVAEIQRGRLVTVFDGSGLDLPEFRQVRPARPGPAGGKAVAE